ncbi:unnamed protein product [Acanthoscelides obtectus]|uniref:Uncharacterized protein n=1 Tax=Acanthoscelides obtectus TaxID=200917 RepID=A0A9P0JHA4_ACAOB|nr:unnamed protein product [Acanthoscelides obtectus]CAK1639936.1 hypothetical protein AOBTE_LOCUS11462 [Acanthoscelides obtectus]
MVYGYCNLNGGCRYIIKMTAGVLILGTTSKSEIVHTELRILPALNGRRMRKRNAVKLSEEYKKRCLKFKTKNTNSNSPATEVSSLLKNIQVPVVVRKRLIFGEALPTDLKNIYEDLQSKHGETKKYYHVGAAISTKDTNCYIDRNIFSKTIRTKRTALVKLAPKC